MKYLLNIIISENWLLDKFKVIKLCENNLLIINKKLSFKSQFLQFICPKSENNTLEKIYKELYKFLFWTKVNSFSDIFVSILFWMILSYKYRIKLEIDLLLLQFRKRFISEIC